MTKPVSQDELFRLNSLLDDTLQQADKQQLISCVRILSTTVAKLKIKYKADEENFPIEVKKMVSDLEQDLISPELSAILSKSIIECATAIAVAKKSVSEKQ